MKPVLLLMMISCASVCFVLIFRLKRRFLRRNPRRYCRAAPLHPSRSSPSGMNAATFTFRGILQSSHFAPFVVVG